MKPLQHYQNVQNEMKTWVDESMRPRYHFTAPAGFINDPNGFTVYNGKYQLFYQARYENCVGWGHAESADLMHFTHLPLAIFPGEEYDKDGCWSGGAIEKEGKLYLLYTGQNNATDLILLYVEHHTALTAFKFYDLTIHNIGKSLHPTDTVRYLHNTA